AKKSCLVFYLNECELKSKLDMPFYRMLKYYEKALKKQNVILTSTILIEQTEIVKYPDAYVFPPIKEFKNRRSNEIKKCLAPLKAKKEDIDLVISSLDLGKGLSLSEAIEQVL
ncbi:6815_t:CDS:2, partial [Funneliformis geosporum]